MARPPNKTGTSQIILVLGTVAAVAVVGGALYQAQKLSNEEELAMMEVIPQQLVTEAVVAAPQVPEAVIPEPETTIAVQPEPKTTPVMKAPQLPTLDNSDDFVRDRLLLIKHRADVETWLNTDDLIRRTASYMDGLSRGVVLSKIFPLTAPEGNFTTHRDGEIIWLNAGNYERYNSTVAAIISLDMKSMAKMFHFIRPLLESALRRWVIDQGRWTVLSCRQLIIFWLRPLLLSPSNYAETPWPISSPTQVWKRCCPFRNSCCAQAQRIPSACNSKHWL